MEMTADLDLVCQCVKLFRRYGPNAELEIRIGHKTDERFVPGVSRDVFEQLERDFCDSPGLVAERHWTELVDYFYPLQNGEQARTRVEFDTEHLEMKGTHVVKRSLNDVFVRRMEDATEVCRLECSEERPLETPPNMCIPTFVRVKQRRRFLDRRDDCTVWCYELSKTWSASSRVAVEHKQHVSEPVYEVECELLDENMKYTTVRSDEQVSASLLLKMKLLLGEEKERDVEIVAGKSQKATTCKGRRRK